MPEPESERLTEGADPPEDDPAAHLRDAVAQAGELKAYAQQFVAAKVDSAKLGARKAVVGMALGLIGVVIGLTVVGVAVGLFLNGLAEGIGVGLGGRRWAGNLIVGGGLILLIAVGGWLGSRMYFAHSRKATIARYERMHHEQREAKGIDASERARD